MNSETGFVFKVLVVSFGLAAAIKHLAPHLTIPATTTNALIAVLSPSLVMATILGWRAWRQRSLED